MALENELPPAILSSEFMTDVHLFSGTSEFSQNNMKQKQFDETVKTFRDSFFEDMLSEYPLHFLSKWYKTINKFSTVLENLKYMEDAGTSVVWRYDDSVAIVPFAYVNSIAMAFEAYKKATEFQGFKDNYFKQREAES